MTKIARRKRGVVPRGTPVGPGDCRAEVREVTPDRRCGSRASRASSGAMTTRDPFGQPDEIAHATPVVSERAARGCVRPDEALEAHARESWNSPSSSAGRSRSSRRCGSPASSGARSRPLAGTRRGRRRASHRPVGRSRMRAWIRRPRVPGTTWRTGTRSSASSARARSPRWRSASTTNGTSASRSRWCGTRRGSTNRWRLKSRRALAARAGASSCWTSSRFEGMPGAWCSSSSR